MEKSIKEYPEKIWIGWDWAQAEMYFLALFSKDSALKEALYSQDFHKYVASLVDDVSIDEVGAEQREMAKTLSYNLIYSGFNIGITRANILKKRLDLTEDKISEALEKYQEVFFCLFGFVKKAVVDWFQNLGYMSYFLGAKKFIPVPAYFKCEPNKMLNSKEGRLCINTYGQNSVGLLLKCVYSNMFRNTVVREHTFQHIPIFDSMNFLVDTKYLDSVMRIVNEYATPVIEHDNFEIRMKVSWKLSTKSWGELKRIEIPEIPDNEAIIYEW
jgi:DNA polymerase I-like protein with 3'-5' exonuclease and polymerase domains